MKKYLWIVFIAMAGIFNACMDVVTHHYGKSIFAWFKNPQWFNPEVSWINKYIDLETLTRKTLFGIIDMPVMFTDHWHLMKAAMLLCVGLSIVLYRPVFDGMKKGWSIFIDFIIARAAFGVAFTLFYNWILVK